MKNPERPLPLAELLERGGFYYNLPGTSPESVLLRLVETIPLPASVKRDELLTAVLEREALMPTAAGGGIAIPHARSPVVSAAADQFVSLAFPEKPVDWGALDNRPVTAVFLSVLASPKLHLRTIQRLSFFCRDSAFCSLLENRSPPEAILSCIRKTETGWDVSGG
ncbi:MAG: PTS sugar transporter subunit IIA [Treponema sp.]|jgi:PTS system nitrogen regulatory IIA component|nr:PTS sugar transporter subunit IIA [Treponema sp.]